MGSLIVTKISSLELLIPFLLISISVTGHQFDIGGERGWARPLGNETEGYIEWAEQHRFHIGDTIYFKYQDDSVLLVKKQDYNNCNGSSPVEGFGEGGATFEFNRHGYFYFITGNQGNCEAGQKIIIRVMVQDEYHPSSIAPAPSPVGPVTGVRGSDGGGSRKHSGSVSFSSASMVFVASYLITTLTGVLLFLCLLIH